MRCTGYSGWPRRVAPRTPLALVLAMWCTDVVAAVLARALLRWPEVVALHPGDLGRGAATASAETIAEATLRCSSGFDWARVHRRAVRGDGALPSDLRRSEVNWMDPTMYGRWVIDSMVDPLLACEVLRTHANAVAAQRLAAVAVELAARCPTAGERGPPSG